MVFIKFMLDLNDVFLPQRIILDMQTKLTFFHFRPNLKNFLFSTPVKHKLDDADCSIFDDSNQLTDGVDGSCDAFEVKWWEI